MDAARAAARRAAAVEAAAAAGRRAAADLPPITDPELLERLRRQLLVGARRARAEQTPARRVGASEGADSTITDRRPAKTVRPVAR
jgi:hypothetical protein